MEVSKTFFTESLLPLFKSRASLDEKTNHEIEATVLERGSKGQTVPIDRASFMHLLSHLLSIDSYTQQETQDSLDVQWDGIRCTIKGLEPISTYCKTSRFDWSTTDVIRKRRMEKPVMMDEYPLKIRSNAESVVSNVRSSGMGTPKVFRLKKRMSFVSGRTRTDLTIVKQASASSLIDSRIQLAREMYEVEVEYIGEYDPNDDAQCQRACGELLQGCANVLEIMSGGWQVVPKTSDVTRAFSEYLETINKRIDSAERTMFIGPQPVTLERRHICKPGPGVLSVLKDYTVTDKADGLRMLLFVASDGMVYLLDSKLNVTATGINVGSSHAKTLIDGEFVTHTRLGPGVRLFMAFDVYYNQGRDVRGLPLAAESSSVENRLDILQAFVTSIAQDDVNKMSIRCKSFYCDSDKLLESCKHILIAGNLHSKHKDDTMPYYIDGLIFTPRDLPVGGLYVGDTPRDGTWPLAFKWKPPQYNSIDFRVEIDKADFVVSGSNVYKVGALLVGATDDGAGGAIGYLNPLEKSQMAPGKGRYVLRAFNPVVALVEHVDKCHLLVDTGGEVRCENGDGIESGCIVEFRYDLTDSTTTTPFRWKPMRVRHDKVRPNFSTIAVSNWKSIQFPVTEGMVCGEDQVNEDDVLDDDAYYLRIYSRDKSATKPMLHFHNHWVKDAFMMSRVADENGKIASVLDIACGKGNDLPRWIKYKVDRVVGIDIVEENILSSEDGAYARVRGSRQRDDIRHAFVTLDASKPIDSSAINQIEHPGLREIARSAWGIEKTDQTGPVFGIAVDKFQVVTCNFAVHYFFDKEASLKTFVANVAKHVAKGGYFIGTCFDRARIERLLRSVPVGKEASAEKNGRTIWSIARLYNDTTTEFGSKITVYIETIGKKNVEYLVDFARLTQELSVHNIELHSSGTFDQLFDDLVTSRIRGNKFFDGPDGALKMSDAEKQLSFLNRWFIFKKQT